MGDGVTTSICVELFILNVEMAIKLEVWDRKRHCLWVTKVVLQREGEGQDRGQEGGDVKEAFA